MVTLDSKSKYRELCRSSNDIPIFSMDWWLDITAGDSNWDVSVVESGGEIIASLPYYRTKKYGCEMIRMPELTPAMGVWIRYPSDQKYATRLAYEKETFTKLIDNLPDFDSFYQHFHWSVTNWMPFHWKGFTQSTDYTYLLEDTSDLDTLFSGFRENIRREIRKAQKQLTVEQSDDIAKFYQVQCKTYQRQNLKPPHTFEFLKKLDDACKSRGCRAMWFASDSEGQIHSVIYVVWDSKYVYYLMGGGDPTLRTSGAMSLLMWKAIQEASRLSRQFDFVGSMFESIDRFFRGFGAVQKPYFQLSKTNGKLMRVVWLAKEAYRLLR